MYAHTIYVTIYIQNMAALVFLFAFSIIFAGSFLISISASVNVRRCRMPKWKRGIYAFLCFY